MSRFAYLFSLTSFLFLMGVFHFVSIKFSLYWSFSNLDNIMHFLGGFVAGWYGLAYFFLWKPFQKKTSPSEIRYKISNSYSLSVVVTAFFSALLVGLAWEVYELGIIDANFNFYYDVFGKWSWMDTLADLVFDCLGGLAAGLYFLFSVPRTTGINPGGNNCERCEKE